jgi:hypothetical protein
MEAVGILRMEAWRRICGWIRRQAILQRARRKYDTQ